MSEWPDAITYRPIDTWPGTMTRARGLSPFSAPLRSTLVKMRKELVAIRAKNVVLQIALRESQFRIDGAPYAKAIPEHPGVILAMETPDGPLKFPCDKFTDWTDNLRAIVLTMERLRQAGFYGVTGHGEQYAGWRAIDAPRASREEDMSFLGRIANLTPADYAGADNTVVLDALVRRALRNAHPDRGGTAELFQAVKDAEKRLRTV